MVQVEEQSTALPFRLSEFAASLKRNPIRDVSVRCRELGGLSLAGGRPAESTFPLRTVSASGPNGANTGVIALDDDTLNYGPATSAGFDPLREWVRQMIEHHVTPQYSDWDVLITSGNTDCMWKTVLLCSEPGETVLTDAFTYPGILMATRPFGRIVEGVGMDVGGMCPNALNDACANAASLNRPARILYIMGAGQNPTSVSMTMERRSSLYAVAQQWNLVILEDDPYCQLVLSRDETEPTIETVDGFVSPIPSMLSIDVDGRVVRCDSFSKTLSPGYRLGYITLHRALAHKLIVTTEVTSWAISGPGQAIVFNLLNSWGKRGYDTHIRELQVHYSKLRNNLVAALNLHMSDLVEFEVPRAGMFIWVRVRNIEDSAQLVEPFLQEQVMAVPGSSFSPSAAPSPFVRLSFTQCSAELANTACERMARAIRAYLASRV